MAELAADTVVGVDMVWVLDIPRMLVVVVVDRTAAAVPGHANLVEGEGPILAVVEEVRRYEDMGVVLDKWAAIDMQGSSLSLFYVFLMGTHYCVVSICKHSQNPLDRVLPQLPR